MDSSNAITQLEAAFAHKARPAVTEEATARPWVGCFGNGIPEVLLAAAGCRVVDVKSVPEPESNDRHEGINQFIEPFLDDYTQLFLNRLANGWLNHLTAIVFSRQDAAALVAYQYALEYQRQGYTEHPFPALLLWNAEQGSTAAVLRFNQHQADKLVSQLVSLGDRQPDDAAIATAIEHHRSRCLALEELTAAQCEQRPRLTGLDAFRWRNAGRYLEAEQFQALLRAALSGRESKPVRTGKRLGLVGSATDSEALYRVLDSVGILVADLQPFGRIWPGPVEGVTDSDSLLQAMARDPFCPRGHSSIDMINALADACAEARCDAVIAQMDQNDDTFGWDLPSLQQALTERGIPVINLGFRDFRPDESACTQMREHLTLELGA
ncbi:2-hydroxyacyl-CoA dehydratase [Saccharospirillum sp.]|uniref:2-hydroxyacyl-CoA dehydratase n=1 Tax=Saccharospirillum sp. TaxID=2033801 RepID=UPI0034A074D1